MAHPSQGFFFLSESKIMVLPSPLLISTVDGGFLASKSRRKKVANFFLENEKVSS